MSRLRKENYIAAADLLRVFCVGMVAWFHFWQQSWLDPGFRVLGVWIDVQRVVRRGYMMVDGMLLLSGFLLYLPVARRALRGQDMPDTKGFYLRRLARILPSYLLAVLVAAALAGIYGVSPGGAPLWKDLLAHLTFTHTFWRDTYLWTSLNGALWTLAVEMQFYLIFPLAARAFRRRPVLTWAGMTALALACRALTDRAADPSILFNQLPNMLDLYAFGMMAAHLLARRRGRGRHWAYGLGSLACLAGVIWVMWAQSPADSRDLQRLQMVWRLPLAALFAGFLWCGGMWGHRLSRWVGNRALRFLAGISYNFYIWHQYLAVKLKTWHIPAYYTSDVPQMTEGLLWRRRYDLLCWCAALLAAVLATYLVERPAADCFRKKESPLKADPPAAA